MIDVSGNNGRVDWRKVAASGVAHAYVKATEGVSFVDPRLVANCRDAHAAGVTVGLYHFAHPSNPPHREAAHFLRSVAGLVAFVGMVPMLDLELTEGLGWTYLDAWKAQWFAAVDHELGQLAGFYSYYYYWKLMHLLEGRPVWGAAYGAHFTAPSSWTLRQYSARGRVPGVSGPVDLSVRLTDWPLLH